ncbi:hypothetical protein GIY23_20485 [Allosaccharopolyspora coralli]|uniref:Arylamine N-acetyltransferase n=1 Tax=Allosaccharopolyspora coralli TaxID=2665642 RepID=A0A5Q3QL66_9PSEU|nr:arylamine N-acetyltransferase [Allosaccharopolyspora coralli]QGK71577.1 hypothetical protein GIY23_20485 [Allosaccharopolyspora coralli]
MSADSEPADEWNIRAVDVGEYLDRVELARPEPTADALWSLHEAHVETFPFENVDVVLGGHRGLALDVLAEKFLRRRRGGYCYEHALLFAAVLEQLGYRVQRRIARVKPHQPGASTHMVLAVEAEGAEYFVDIAFGAGMLHPMPMRDGAHADQAGWRHRLTWDGVAWTLEKRTRQGWEPQHASTELPQHRSESV